MKYVVDVLRREAQALGNLLLAACSDLAAQMIEYYRFRELLFHTQLRYTQIR